MVVTPYRRFGTTYRSHIQGSRGLDSWPVKMGPIGCHETSVRKYHSILRNIPEDHISHVLRGWNPKSSKTDRIYLSSPSGTSYLRRANFATRHPEDMSCFFTPRGNCCDSALKHATTTSSHIFLSYICHSDTEWHKKTGTFEKLKKNWRNPRNKNYWQKLNHYNLLFKRQ